MSSKRSRAAFEDRDTPPSHAPYALYGTPLPPYDEQTRDDGSYVPIWKQEVTDERGRKRLHGAFTGGFSAGYFNTVGSKEGWTPSTFVSSRSNRAKDSKDAKQQRAEDFMDEEDLAEQAEATKLETQGSFAGLGTGGQDGSAGGMFSDFFKNTGETKGVKLLQRMGWRQGQGIGPKVKRRAQGDKTGEMHLFAPENTRMISLVRKTDKKGLGFEGEGKLREDSTAKDDDEDSGEDSRILSRSKIGRKPKPLKKSGFGVGVLNDDGEDDEDPYAVGPSISYNRIIGQKKKKGGLVASNANPNVIKPTFQPSKKLVQRSTNVNNFRKCHDGRLPLDGFVLAAAALTISENKYPPPEVPPGWKPALQSSASSSTPYMSTADAAKASTLDAKGRAELLGEQQLPSKSIFDFITPAQRDKLASASGRNDLPAALSEKAPEGYTQSEAEKHRTLWDLVPDLSKETAVAALARGKTGWMPYSEDPEKRERYKYFLELSTGQQNSLPSRATGTSLEEWANELREFAEAAEIFKPVSGYMASRFTSGSATPKLASDAPDSASQSASAKEEDPAVKAARMGMYGPLTRKREQFYPTRLLCKRFNVRPPANVAAGSSAAEDAAEAMEKAERLDLVSKVSLERMMRDAGKFVSRGTEGGKDERQETGPASGNVRAQVDVEKNEALEGSRPGEDVFRAIFGSDDED
ncbi:hypothetical protein CKM354_000415000 [Cercospora kikuchii]|uniref:G-patch domain-containing protein n=1 Tax=Cercospora kikuchii TaxID=84275 RepID=A0A9P3CDM0_9PEZI|nr:uncharacterized protein CKM354_000415000 [Cercospora kikuchii]GIZ40826.1 hypothetical protein CKM354_000415000 [Cercospora kikuchii]